ncbi:MAG: 2,3-bisphosphoglycerate-dependent phosphoglycerate mutase [Pseudomonadota bacterium]
MQNALVLVRHGQSEWNKRNLFTGWRNPDLTEQGVHEAHRAGQLLKQNGFKFDVAYTSLLLRANRTLDLMLGELEQADLATHKDQALNERDYGDISGMNKDEARDKWGAEQIHIWRRSFDIPPPGGESLKDTAERVIPYYTANIWPEIQAGKSVIVAAHGNSIRALIMHLEKLSPEAILKREVATGAPLIYKLNADGSVETFVDLVTGPGGEREGQPVDTTS